jgi:hypothetical protein
MDIDLLRLSAAIATMIADGWRHSEFVTDDHEYALLVVKHAQEADRTSDAQRKARHRGAALAAWQKLTPDLRHRIERIDLELRQGAAPT